MTGQIGQIPKIKKYVGWNEAGDHSNVFHLIFIHPGYSLVHPKLPVVAVERGGVSTWAGGGVWRGNNITKYGVSGSVGQSHEGSNLITSSIFVTLGRSSEIDVWSQRPLKPFELPISETLHTGFYYHRPHARFA